MSTHVYQVIAKKVYGKLAIGMNVEIIIRNASRPPSQREIIDAINQKYGPNTAVNGLSLSNFDIRKL
ncbi:peptidase [Empedobacter sp. GD03739]|uniref:peptidase n=1 Tax=Empedobacter sp. GD03739 TaxID=2975376 RepID=UPI000EEB78B4|nr:peptidase [Empedobacter sp. GD03739]MDH1603780.1 peptidase [Empedobacter sp. GD03739]HAD79384.1 peptidase [Flavobacteriaceae bacterium]